MKTSKPKEKENWKANRSIRFDRDKLKKLDEMGLKKHLSNACRKALDKLIGK